MMGCGTEGVLEAKFSNQLLPIRNGLDVIMQGEIGTSPAPLRRDQTEIKTESGVTLYVGDSFQSSVNRVCN